MRLSALISTIIALPVLAASFVSCRRDDPFRTVEQNSEGEMIDVEFVVGAETGTKAGGDASLLDDNISRFTVVLFRNGSLYYTKTVTGPLMSVSVNSGTYDIIAVVNDSNFSPSGITPSNASSRTSSFWNEGKTMLHMCGKKLNQPLTSSSSVTVPATRLVSRVVLGNVYYDISTTNIPWTDSLKIKKVFLTNVWTDCGYGNGTSSLNGFGATPVTIPDHWLIDNVYGSPWINYHGLESFNTSSSSSEPTIINPGEPIEVGPSIGDEIFIDPSAMQLDLRSDIVREMVVKDYGDNPLIIGTEDNEDADLTFYAYPNSSLVTAANASIPCTRLVIYATIGNEECYYHVDLPGMIPNTSYNVDVAINNYGGFDEEHNYEKPSLDVTVSVESWETGFNQTFTFE